MWYGNKQILFDGGKKGREPWINTVAYFPFIDDQNDHSWNWIVISWSWTKNTIWFNFNSNALISINDCNWFCTWVKSNSASWNGSVGSYYDKKSMWWYWYDNWSNNASIWTFYTSSYARVSVPLPNPWQRNFIWIWYDWTNTVYCLNDTYWILRTWSWYNFWNTFAILWKSSWVSCNISYSEFIVEKIIWNQSESLKYYNKTKSKYWY